VRSIPRLFDIGIDFADFMKKLTAEVLIISTRFLKNVNPFSPNLYSGKKP